jgi:predicted DNA-binding transcriptional regulator AlpA
MTVTSLPDPAQRLITVKQLTELTARSRASLYRDVAAGRLPQPIKIGASLALWRRDRFYRGDGGEVTRHMTPGACRMRRYTSRHLHFRIGRECPSKALQAECLESIAVSTPH